MNTKTLIIVGIVILSLALFVFGKEAISYLSGAREYTRDAVKERIPPELQISRQKSMLGKLDKVIEKRRGTSVDMQLQSERLQKEIQRRHKNLAGDRTALEKAAALLEKEQDSYVIGGLTYSYAEVDADARIKAERFRQDQELLAARETTLGRFADAVNDARRIVSDTDVERQGLARLIANAFFNHIGVPLKKAVYPKVRGV